jgi:hypothetical protein
MDSSKDLAVNGCLLHLLNSSIGRGEISKIRADKEIMVWREINKHADRGNGYNNWTNITSRRWWQVLGKKSYCNALDDMVNRSVILRTKTYSAGRFPRSYKIHENYRSRSRCGIWTLTHKPTIEANRRSKRIKIEGNDPTGKFIANWLHDFKVEVDDRISKDIWSLENVSAINQGQYFAIRDKFAGRFHSSFTQLRKEVRSKITYQGKPTYSLDIACCQPLLLGIIATDHQKGGHIEGYGGGVGEWVQRCESGEVYDELQQLVAKSGSPLYRNRWATVDLSQLSRKRFKRECLQVLMEPHQASIAHPLWAILNQFFPAIAALITDLKTTTHINLSQRLQKLEAHIMLDLVSGRHQEIELPILTIHDEIITPDPNRSEEIIKKAFLNFGISPTIKRK